MNDHEYNRREELADLDDSFVTAQVESILDGETVKCLATDGRRFTLDLADVDAYIGESAEAMARLREYSEGAHALQTVYHAITREQAEKLVADFKADIVRALKEYQA